MEIAIHCIEVRARALHATVEVMFSMPLDKKIQSTLLVIGYPLIEDKDLNLYELIARHLKDELFYLYGTGTKQPVGFLKQDKDAL